MGTKKNQSTCVIFLLLMNYYNYDSVASINVFLYFSNDY